MSITFDTRVLLPATYMPYVDFAPKFGLEATSTEKRHEITRNISQVMHDDVERGLDLLLQVDEKALEDLRAFIPTLDTHAKKLAGRMKEGGRVFFVGAGSSTFKRNCSGN